jgi:hypothetical protein
MPFYRDLTPGKSIPKKFVDGSLEVRLSEQPWEDRSSSAAFFMGDSAGSILRHGSDRQRQANTTKSPLSPIGKQHQFLSDACFGRT